MSSSLNITLAGEVVSLWPGCALHWPAQETLFIADPHFGKAATFRAMGIAAPDSTRQDLKRLDDLLALTASQRLVVLGDFFHARQGRSTSTLEALQDWRSRQAPLEVILVPGNHDRGAGTPPDSLNIESVSEPWNLGPFCCRHLPESGAEGHVLAGHVHPGIGLRDRNGAWLRARCFVVRPHLTILPAFGEFTGLKLMEREVDQKLFAVSEEAVVPLP